VRVARRLVVLLVIVLLGGAETSLAADVVSPADGETVSSLPSFVVDYAEGTLEVELARTADTLTQGDKIGQFVEPVASDFMLIGTSGRPPNIATWDGSKLSAGRYFWHARPNDYATEFDRGFSPHPWGPTRTIVVRDEPPVIEGWTLGVRRLRSQGFCDRVHVSGVLRVSDNAQPPLVRLTVLLTADGKTLTEAGEMVDAETAEGTFERTFCTRASVVVISLQVADPSGQVSSSESRRVRIASAKRRSAAQIVRDEFRDYKAALRDGDGTRACELMDARYRASFRRNADQYGLWDSCEELVRAQGRSIYREANHGRLGITNVRVRGRYAAGCLTPRYSGSEFFVRSTKGWRLHQPTRLTTRRFPRVCA
jgi:hypothetical protein